MLRKYSFSVSLSIEHQPAGIDDGKGCKSRLNSTWFINLKSPSSVDAKFPRFPISPSHPLPTQREQTQPFAPLPQNSSHPLHPPTLGQDGPQVLVLLGARWLPHHYNKHCDLRHPSWFSISLRDSDSLSPSPASPSLSLTLVCFLFLFSPKPGLWSYGLAADSNKNHIWLLKHYSSNMNPRFPWNPLFQCLRCPDSKIYQNWIYLKGNMSENTFQKTLCSYVLKWMSSYFIWGKKSCMGCEVGQIIQLQEGRS